MNVYEAIEKSPVHRAWHASCGVASQGDYLKDLHDYYPDGWQPLAVLEQYTLGEPLTEATKEQNYNAVNKITGKMYQGTPRPVLPEKKPRYTLRDCGAYWRVLRDEQSLCVCENRLDAEGLVLLLNESEAKDD